MIYAMTGGFRVMQFFPGEGVPGDPTPAGTGVSWWLIPGNYFSNPELYGFPQQPSPWGFTEERRATLALYDYRRTDIGIGDG